MSIGAPIHDGSILNELEAKFGAAVFTPQDTRDGVPTAWVDAGRAHEVLHFLKRETARPYRMLYDLFGMDERQRAHRAGQPPSDFTLVYHLLSLDRNTDVRIKVPLTGGRPSAPSMTDLWPSANWYERETWDMFGIRFDGHPGLRRLLMPTTWKGHPLRKEHPSRATEMAPFTLSDSRQDAEEQALQFNPEEWGMKPRGEDCDFMFLNLGPHHPGTHGPLRLILQLDGEQIVDVVPDIGYHHRGAEKMGERQSWHRYIPYTDRIDYLAGVLNNLPYVLAVETLAGISVPPRAEVIRVMMCELFRIISHLVFCGTLAGDLGAMGPLFYEFNARERAFDLVEAVTGARMHPSWFRIGGVAQDLPRGWERLFREFLAYLPGVLAEFETLTLRSSIFKARTQGIGRYTAEQAIEWGVTGPGLRACGLDWDLRKKRPYSGYDRFDFEVATAQDGDCYARTVVHVEEMRQSLRIIEQCISSMPAGPYKSDHPLTTPPARERTLQDIETLITHFLAVTWGPVIPPGEAIFSVEGAKGMNGYYLISDGGTGSYRTRIRTPSFAHVQMTPEISRGLTVADLVAILGSMDYVLADVDR